MYVEENELQCLDNTTGTLSFHPKDLLSDFSTWCARLKISKIIGLL